MARPLRIAFPGVFYHVTARGNERKTVFKSKRDRETFLEYLETATERYQAVIHAYCLMDNLDSFCGPIKAAQKGYEKFVSQLADKDCENPVKALFGSVLPGSQAFINSIKNEFISSRKPDKNVLALIQLASQATIPDICQTVESVLGDTPRLSRKAQIFLCRKHTTASLAVIGDRFGIGDSAVSQSYSRFLNSIKTDRHLRRQVEKIEKMIKMCNVRRPDPEQH